MTPARAEPVVHSDHHWPATV